MRNTVSRRVHDAVQTAISGSRILNTRAVAEQIARQHGIGKEGIWLVEQALTMVGARAGCAMMIGADASTGLSRNGIPALPRQAIWDNNEQNSSA